MAMKMRPQKYGHKNVTYVEDKRQVSDTLKTIVQPGDIIITMGAGDIYRSGDEFVQEIESGNFKLERH